MTSSSLASWRRHAGDEARSVYSPAAYLADLLQLIDDRFRGAALTENRRLIKEIPLDAANFTEVPYLDIVNEVLGGAPPGRAGGGPYEAMTGMTSPFGLPFSLADLRRRNTCSSPALPRTSSTGSSRCDRTPTWWPGSISACRAETYDLVTTAATGEPEVKADYQLDDAEFTTLQAVDRFLARPA